jgi:hypothetical protein
MRDHPRSLPVAAFAVLAAGLVLGGCSGMSLPSFSGSGSEPAPPPSAASVPSKYAPEELIGRWGYTSYQNEADRARTVNTARGLCRNPYVIARGPSGGVMMHLADQRQPSELRLKGSSDGRNYIGPDGPAGGEQDREIVSFDGRVLIARYVDSDAANRYGNQVYVRCAASGRG